MYVYSFYLSSYPFFHISHWRVKYIDKTYHQISLKNVFLSFLTKLFNKFYNIQGISQHLRNKQNVNTLKYTNTWLIFMRLTYDL